MPNPHPLNPLTHSYVTRILLLYYLYIAIVRKSYTRPLYYYNTMGNNEYWCAYIRLLYKTAKRILYYYHTYFLD